MRSRCRAALLLAGLLVAPAARGWRLAPFASDETGTRAVALATDGRAAAGDGRGVWITGAGGSARRVDLAGAARDLAFADDGTLWIASEAGLFAWRDGRLSEATPAPGDRARDAARVAVAGAVVAVATAEGVHLASDGARFGRVEVPLGESGAAGIALSREADGGIALWVAGERGLWRAPAAAGARAERVALDPDLRPALDVAADGARVVALGPSWIATRGADGRFAVRRLALPPGATPQRVAWTGAGLAVATDRGLVAAASPDASFARAGEPAGTAVAWDVAVGAERALVATSRGVLVDDVAPAADASRPASQDGVAACDPPVVAVQRAALAYLRLGGDPAAAMRRGVRLRGWLPLVTLEASRDRERGDGRFEDEAYISSAYRFLEDRDRTRVHDDEVALRLTWDLGDAVYHDEQIDVSTEARRLIELRDDVLDELNQLYFDRRRALAAAADPAAQDAASERLRAAELAAGLDAWTDGWFGRVAAACGAPEDSPPR